MRARARIEELLMVLRAPLRKEAVLLPRQPLQCPPLLAPARTSTTNLDPELSASNITQTQKPSYSSNVIVGLSSNNTL